MTSFINDNGEELQYDGKDFAITKQNISFLDFKIKGDVSTNFKIPNTAKNRETLGYYGVNQIESGAFSIQKFNLIRNGNKVLDGYVFIQKDRGDFFDCFFISGNSNWFSKFQFKCNQVVNDSYSIEWTGGISATNYNVSSNRNNIHGIVFPIVDYFGKGLRGTDVLYKVTELAAGQGLTSSYNSTPTLFPCLYLHTLVEEISKHSGVNISGNLLLDGVYNSLIITPEGPELVDPQTNLRIYQKTVNGDNRNENYVITIGSIAPQFKAIELIRYLCYSFGVIPIYDVASNTLQLNKSASIDKADAEDWTEYLKSYSIEYDKVKSKVTIGYSQPEELEEYNDSNETSFGDLLIDTGKESSGEDTIYKSPFYSSTYDINRNNGAMMGIAYVKFYNLSLEFETTYSTVTDITISIRFEGFGTACPIDTQDCVIEIIDNNNLYSGFYSRTSLNAINANIIFSSETVKYFKGTSSGTIRVYSLNPYKVGNRILRCKTDVAANSFSTFPTIQFGVGVNVSTCSVAWFTKKKGWPTYTDETSINFGDIESNAGTQLFTDVNLGETEMTQIISMVKNPPIRATFLLPEHVFGEYNFTNWIYLNTGEISGYYYVHKIENYVDSQSMVTVELLKVN